MKNLTLLAFIFCACATTVVNDAEAFCARCVEINENNKRNVNEHFYYEDYVEANKQKQ